MPIADQIRVLMQIKNLTQDSLAQALGVKVQLIKDVLRNKQRVPEDLLLKIIEIFNLDANWLVTGEGKVAQDRATYSVDEETLVENYRKAPERGKKVIRQISDRFAEPDNGKGKVK